LTEFVLQEPARAIFHTPFYAAMARGDFLREGVEVRLAIGGESGAALASLVSGEADLGWAEPMEVIRTLAEDPDSALVCFGAAAVGDPFFLVGRGVNSSFVLSDLASLRLGTVSRMPTPWWCLGRDLRQAGLDPESLRRSTGRDMADTLAAVMTNEIDVALLPEPFASLAEQAGGAVWHAAARRGPTAYSAFCATRDRIAARPMEMSAMLQGLVSVQAWLAQAPAVEVSATVASFFPDLAPPVLTTAIARYQGLRIWAADPAFPRDAFERLQAAMLEAGAIAAAPGYETCVIT